LNLLKVEKYWTFARKSCPAGVVFFGIMLNISGKSLVYFIDVREIYIVGVDLIFK
jgi:hypothetical protein